MRYTVSGAPGTMLAVRKSPALSPIVIEGVAPELDGGRYPVKRIIGDSFTVAADVFKDGHDLLAARICYRYRGPGERSWRVAPMRYDYDSDRWSGSLVLDRIGHWVYTVEAWTDVFASWRSGVEKKLAAGQDVSADLLEGAAYVKNALLRSRGEAKARLKEVAALLGDRRAPQAAQAEAALADDVPALVAANTVPRDLTRYAGELSVTVDRERAGFAAWYEMFPRSQASQAGVHGSFADAERRLSALAKLGFDVIYLPPIHPIGYSHRKGPNNTAGGTNDVGSPWAIGGPEGGHRAVHPDLGTLDEFDHFVRAANDLGMEVALDFALNCSPDHPWVKEHSEWFFVRPDGTIHYAENPPKRYQDIYPLNFWCEDREELWTACRDVVEFWIARGVKTFRVDNPHTKPFAFWEWLIAEVQTTHPDVIFLSEAFTRPKRMKTLAKLGFTQSYTYFTWRNTAEELRDYLTELTQTEMAEYFRGNLFVNTPDILHEYLQKGGRPAFLVRLLLAATLSPLYGVYSGFELCENQPLRPGSEEYLDSEKYQIRVRDWNAPGNLNREIAALNRVRRENRALQLYRNLSFHAAENERMLFYRKSAPGNELLVAVNLNPFQAEATMVHVPLGDLGLGPDQAFVVEDLLTGARYTWQGVRNYVRLDPAMGQAGHILRLTLPPRDGRT